VGRHGLLNVLAGIAVAGGIRDRSRTAAGRGSDARAGQDAGRELQPCRDSRVLNDCYNSNPEAVRSMLDVIRATPARRRVAVLGEMLELGRWAEALHRDVGRYAVECELMCSSGFAARPA